MFPIFNLLAEQKASPLTLPNLTNQNAGWGKRRLNRFKIENGIKYQLHATRGWEKVGRVEKKQ